MSPPTATITPEKASQKSMTGSVRSVHQTSFSWSLLQEFVRSTTQLLVAASGDGLPFWEISAMKPRSCRCSWVVIGS